MTEKLLVVSGVDGILVGSKSTDVLREEFVRMGWLRRNQSSNLRAGQRLNMISQAVTGRPAEQIEAIAQKVAGIVSATTFRRPLNFLWQYKESSSATVFAALSTGPNFVISKVIDTIAPELFDHVLTSDFEVVDGRYTGAYKKLYKDKRMAKLCAEIGVTGAETVLVNGMSDAPIMGKAKNVIAVNPGPIFLDEIDPTTYQIISARAQTEPQQLLTPTGIELS